MSENHLLLYIFQLTKGEKGNIGLHMPLPCKLGKTSITFVIGLPRTFRGFEAITLFCSQIFKDHTLYSMFREISSHPSCKNPTEDVHTHSRHLKL